MQNILRCYKKFYLSPKTTADALFYSKIWWTPNIIWLWTILLFWGLGNILMASAQRVPQIRRVGIKEVFIEKLDIYVENLIIFRLTSK